jgi:hypothetical protein
MKSREVVAKDNYKQIVLKRMIILCWILLAVCFMVKIFGGNFFNIVCQNERFIKACEFVDKNVWLQYIIGCISTLFLQTLYLLAISKHLWFTRKREVVIVIITMMLGTGIRVYNSYIGLFVDIYQYSIMPFLIKDEFKISIKIRRIIASTILTFVFQLISLLTKNLSFGFTTENYNFIISIIFMIDVYFMVILYYLYINNKEKNMGMFVSWLWGKSPKTLEKMKQNRLVKIENLKIEVAEIDKELNRRNENK